MQIVYNDGIKTNLRKFWFVVVVVFVIVVVVAVFIFVVVVVAVIVSGTVVAIVFAPFYTLAIISLKLL